MEGTNCLICINNFNDIKSYLHDTNKSILSLSKAKNHNNFIKSTIEFANSHELNEFAASVIDDIILCLNPYIYTHSVNDSSKITQILEGINILNYHIERNCFDINFNHELQGWKNNIHPTPIKVANWFDAYKERMLNHKTCESVRMVIYLYKNTGKSIKYTEVKSMIDNFDKILQDLSV